MSLQPISNPQHQGGTGSASSGAVAGGSPVKGPRPYDAFDHHFPLTFERFFAAAYNQWDGHKTKKPAIHVQVRVRGSVHCAHVVKLGDTMDSGMWFKVQGLQLGITWCESRNVRLCSGDGRCTCARAAGGAPLAGNPAEAQQVRFDGLHGGGFSQAGVVAPPESLTDETLHVEPGTQAAYMLSEPSQGWRRLCHTLPKELSCAHSLQGASFRNAGA
ncbi:hypothetical protein ACO2Q9_03880 [Variovorax sp. VNK109]|uniref:hypothetical protein n=1 Tax=Variovorax sp. VNK109 TaxID=3400919 RepID=UPI003BFC31C5